MKKVQSIQQLHNAFCLVAATAAITQHRTTHTVHMVPSLPFLIIPNPTDWCLIFIV